MGVIYEMRRWDDLRWHDMRTKFIEDRFGYSGNINVITCTLWDAAVSVVPMGRIYDGCWDDLRWHGAYIPSFMTIGLVIQVILRVGRAIA
jgi:hypothetical protein